MPSLRKIPFTKPIPANAEIFTKKGKRYARWIDGKNRPREAELTEDGQRIRQWSHKWYGCYTDAKGQKRCVPLATDKVASQQMLAELVRQAELGKAGLVDPYAEHRQRPLSEHLVDYEAYLRAKGDNPRSVALVISRLKALLLDGCGFVFWEDVSASAVQEHLASLRRNQPIVPLPVGQNWFSLREIATLLGVSKGAVRKSLRRRQLPVIRKGKTPYYSRATVETLLESSSRGLSIQTTNYYLVHAKAFFRWLVKDRRAAENPLAYLEAGNNQLDRRHDRRALTVEELKALLSAARRSEKTFCGLTGWDRYHLYATACGTGFRASALASLTPESFQLDAKIPVVVLAARWNKSRKPKVQPLPSDVASLLRDYLRDKPAGVPLWGGTWARGGQGAEMMRIDLEAAGIPYVVEGPNGPLYADFHALRHTYLTLAGRAGVDLRVLQELAGHSTPLLTARYSHPHLYDLAGAAEKVTGLLPTSSSQAQ